MLLLLLNTTKKSLKYAPIYILNNYSDLFLTDNFSWVFTLSISKFNQHFMDNGGGRWVAPT